MTDEHRSSGALTKSLGFWRLSLYGIGTIIGAGIYSVIGPAAALAGDAIWVSFLVAAVISAFSGLSYAELATAMPSANAEHNFLRQALPKVPAVAFAVGLFIAVHGAATFATVGLTFGSYLETVAPVRATWVALLLMLLATALNISGLRKASAVSATLTVIQVSCLIAFAVFALASQGDSIAGRAAAPESWSGVLQGAAIVFFIYSGYEHMATMTEEAKNPERDIGRAFMVALILTTIAYMMVIFAVLVLVDVRNISDTGFPLVAAATQLGKPLGMIIVGAALLATANAVLSSSLSGSRLLFGMSRSGDLPKALQRSVGKARSPWVAAVVMLTLAAIFVSLGEIKFVASLSSLGVTLVFAAVNAAVIILRYRKPDLRRPFRLLSMGRFPITAGLGFITSLLLATQYETAVYLTFFAAIAAGGSAIRFAAPAQEVVQRSTEAASVNAGTMKHPGNRRQVIKGDARTGYGAGVLAGRVLPPKACSRCAAPNR